MVGDVTGLRNAITAANANGSGLDIICVAAGVYPVSNTASGLNGFPVVSTAIEIRAVGGGATIQRTGGTDLRFFEVNTTGDLTLHDVTLTGGSLRNDTAGSIRNTGRVNIINGAVNNSVARNVGAIYNSGTLVLSNTSMNNNTAIERVGAIQVVSGSLSITGGTFSSNHARWGVIQIDGAATTASVGNATFSNNRIDEDGSSLYVLNGSLSVFGSLFTTNRSRYGGGIYQSNGSLNVLNSFFTNNEGVERGAAIYTTGSTIVNISDSQFDSNRARYGAAVYTRGNITVTRSTFNNNDVLEQGGAIYIEANAQSVLTVTYSTFTNGDARFGGAIYNLGRMTVSGNRFTGNRATERGGAIYNQDASAQTSLSQNCIAGNTALNQASGVYNQNGSLNARNNWWGATNGPGGSGGGSGDSINSGVAFSPFLTSDPGNCGVPSSSTNTPTATVTPSATFTATVTPTSTRTSTPTSSNTSTGTPTNTATNTFTYTPTNTATNTPTDTATDTPTETATDTATDTPTQTATDTATDTPTQTATDTATDTPTETATDTPTDTPTETATNTPTITYTPTPTATPLNVDIEVEKFAPANAPVGELMYTIRVSNLGTVDTTEVIIADILPTGVVFVTSVWINGTNSGECVIGTLPTPTPTFTPTYTSTPEFTATATETAALETPTETTTPDTATNTPTDTPTDTPSATSTDTPTDTPTLDFPTETATNAATPTQTIAPDTVFLCNIGGLAAGETAEITITVNVAAYGEIVNTAVLVSSLPADINPLNDTDTVTTRIEPQIPVLNLDSNNDSGTSPHYQTTFVEGDAGAVLSDDDNGMSDLTLTDVDSPVLTGAILQFVTLSGSSYVNTTPLDAPDALTVETAGTAITAVYEAGTGTLTLSGSDTIENYRVVLASARFVNGSQQPNTTTRIVQFVVSDGTNTSEPVLASVRVLSVNDVSVVTLDADNSGSTSPNFSSSFSEGGAAARIVDDVSISDVDNTTLARVTTTITNLQNGSSEQLSVDTSGTSLSALYADGVLTIYGGGSVSEYQQVLSTLSYINLSQNPNTLPRLILIVVNDGENDSLAALAAVTVNALNNAPNVNLDVENTSTVAPNFVAQYPQWGQPAPLAAVVGVTDPDNDLLTSASVSLSNASANEVLNVDTTGTSLLAQYSSGSLSISGAAPAEVYAQILNTLTYTNIDAHINAPDRTAIVTVSDGSLSSAPVTATVRFNTVVNIPDAPGYVCLDFANGAQGWIDVSTPAGIVWDLNGMYGASAAGSVSASFELPTVQPFKLVFYENGYTSYIVASGSSPGTTSTVLTRQQDGSYFTSQRHITLTWDVNATTELTTMQIFNSFCYQSQATLDLEVTNVNVTEAVVDFTTLELRGVLAATITNNGTTTVDHDFTVIFFEDSNGNDTYEAGIDRLLATSEQTDSLAPGASRLIQLERLASEEPFSTVQFVGNLIHVYVDSGDVVLEVNETNNILWARCEVPPTPTP